MAVNGSNIIVCIGSQPIAATRSNELEVENEIIEISSPNSGAWRDFLAGRKEWSINTDFLVTDEGDTADRVLTVGSVVELYIRKTGTNGTDDVYLSGEAICTKCKITARRSGIISGSFVFRGKGVLEDMRNAISSVQ